MDWTLLIMQYIIVPFGVPAVVALLYYLLKRVDSNMPPGVHDTLNKYARMGVTAAQQKHSADPNEAKKAYVVGVVEDALTNARQGASPSMIDAAIEAAVGEMKRLTAPAPMPQAVPDAKQVV